MADKTDLDFTYSTIDEIFRLSMGETGDFSGARYNGDFTLTLEEAQRAKHCFIAFEYPERRPGAGYGLWLGAISGIRS